MVNAVNYFLIAEDAIRGSDGGLTIVKVFNKLLADKVPIVKPKITLAFGFFPPEGTEENDQLEIKLEVIAPNGKVVAELAATAKRTEPKPSDGIERELTSSVDLSDGLVLPKFGVYTIKLWCQGELLAENRFEVVKK